AKKGRLDDAISEYRQAIRINKDFAEAYCGLGFVLRQQGEFQQALEMFRRGHKLGSKIANWSNPSAQWVRECEHLVELEGQLRNLLKGKTTPATAEESIELAILCSVKRFNRAGARLYQEAFVAKSALMNDLESQHRYNAACAAALAGSGQGKDCDTLQEEE